MTEAGSTAPAENRDSALRDQLAADRTRLANERTLLAYVRTALMLLASGATVIELYSDRMGSVISGALLVALGLVTVILGIMRYQRVTRSLSAAEFRHASSSSNPTP